AGSLSINTLDRVFIERWRSISKMSVETARLIKQSLKTIGLGGDAEKVQTGKDFFKYFFTNYPDLRVYYKGSETFTAEDVQKSDGFDGQKLFLAVHLLAEIYDNQEVAHLYNKRPQRGRPNLSQGHGSKHSSWSE
ncbi:hypothetical protein PRIPAC_94548, partial [Pristionchus pacificus]|uniref:GLOBIN domain-containing protein n=1 Tax=Pristionchus pacificus TaxID=54126 RepID=A0A2A6CE44_PRIPA